MMLNARLHHFVFRLVICVLVATLCAGQYTDIDQFPSFELLRSCAQLPTEDADDGPILEYLIGCETGGWVCACDNFGAAESAVASYVFQACSDTADVASATSVLNAFCAQYPLTTSLAIITSPTQNAETTSTAGHAISAPAPSDSASSTGTPPYFCRLSG
jgi:hypothetical protein